MRLLLIKFTIIGLIYSCTFNNKSTKNKIDIQELVKQNQILLTNEANFKGHSGLYGASSSLVHFRNKVFAVTAKHLLGSDGGVEPEINPKDLALYFEEWIMYPRININNSYDTIRIKKTLLNYDQVNSDILLLEVENSKNNIFTLTPNFELPNEKDSLFVIGCPYNEENCRQNIYKVIYTSYDLTSNSLICVIEDEVNLAGFSGAPVLDIEGKIVGILTGAWEENGREYVVATSIREMNKIK
jgi:Trypsin-like peptidase domain